MRRLVTLVLLWAALLAPAAPPALAAGADRCPPGQTPHFAAGFAALSARLGATMGAPTTCEYPDPKGTGDVEQNTTRGLAFWRKSTNTPTFTDGYNHWAITARGLVTWQGSAVDPPGAASPAATPQAAGGFTYAVVEEPQNPPGKLFCLANNPSCSRDPWWAEWNQVGTSEFVQYRFLGPGFVTERRFVEAVWLLWRWPEGQTLLQSAADQRVRVVTASSAALPTAFAAFAPSRRLIGVNDDYTATATWMVADLLAHELRHAADQAEGARQDESSAACIAREQVAYQTEARYLGWIGDEFGGLPPASRVARDLSFEDYLLYRNLKDIATAPDVDVAALDDYRKTCAA